MAAPLFSARLHLPFTVVDVVDVVDVVGAKFNKINKQGAKAWCFSLYNN